MFRSTPPRGGRHRSVRATADSSDCFDPRPRAGGDAADGGIGSAVRVSIHAPARGATPALPASRLPAMFRSTPPRGGRRRPSDQLPALQDGFDPRPRAGGDADRHVSCEARRRFRSTPPRGGRPGDAGADRSACAFRSTPPRGGRRRCRTGLRVSSEFRSTPPRGGRLVRRTSPREPLMRFDPRPRAGGDARRDGCRCRLSGVSIHAPARGATGGIEVVERGLTDVSIHAPARGATSALVHAISCDRRFDPRPRAGGDRSSRRHRSTPTRVSIHAPARGATRRHRTTRCRDRRFRSTPPRGGRRLRPVELHDADVVSIHAPARGATGTDIGTLGDAIDVSIHAPARGATGGRSRVACAQSMFRSTPPRGGRRAVCGLRLADREFRSTPPRGGRPLYR